MVKLRAPLPADRTGWILTGTTFAGAVGFGSFAAGSVIFFTRSIGLSVGQVGLGVAIAGVVGLLGPLLVGRVADRVGAREVFVLVSLLQAALFGAYAVVHTFPVFLAVVCGLGFAERSAGTVRNAVIAGMTAGGERVRLKAYLRSVFNIGVSLGAAGAAIPLHLDTRSAYLALVFFSAAAAALTAGLAMALPRVVPPDRRSDVRRWLALRDIPYLAMAVHCGLLATHHSLLAIALPIWVVTRTDAPGSVVSALFVLNTVMAIALQVRVSKHAGTVRGATGAARRGARAIAPACALIAIAAFVPVAPAVALLAAGVALLTVGELLTSVASWALSFELASTQAPAQYQGAFALGMSVESIAGPLLATVVVLGLGVPGWLVAAAVFLLLGHAARDAARWATTSRSRFTSVEQPLVSPA
ncbi:MAG: MFS transporter [Actinomycetota bacterium]|nr:MFS transporter [Actinomycetota bacterium]